ncbi:MAG TPA: rRNA maturation RNase YbeY [Paracoccaceae bacterium]|nr:rRNA maturation RNase YbeY [Paracoccaceae bacterium]HMO72862.1 rRNA maturation RNase YbeY [Paracoccaceae bacterium]
MEPLVDTVIEDARWDAAGLPGLAERAAAAVLVHLGLPRVGFQISVMGCDDTRIAALNAGFRGKAAPTNVLSWPAEELSQGVPGSVPARPAPGVPDDPRLLGDIALAWETCAAEAEMQGKSLPDHATHLIVHATLHLLGHDHENDADAELMETTETRILSALGIADPYG